MITTKMETGRNKSLVFWICGMVIFLFIQLSSFGQPHPPRPIQVYTVKDINFGAFVQGISGGTVIIYPNGFRSTTGDIQQLNLGYQFYPAIFEIDVLPGTVISILFGPDAILSGSNGGSMIMHVGSSDPQSPFVTTVNPPGHTQVRVGGTLVVGNPNANPPGAYSGIFSVTFNQE
jgi:hypothetical protein